MKNQPEVCPGWRLVCSIMLQTLKPKTSQRAFIIPAFNPSFIQELSGEYMERKRGAGLMNFSHTYHTRPFCYTAEAATGQVWCCHTESREDGRASSLPLQSLWLHPSSVLPQPLMVSWGWHMPRVCVCVRVCDSLCAVNDHRRCSFHRASVRR